MSWRKNYRAVQNDYNSYVSSSDSLRRYFIVKVTFSITPLEKQIKLEMRRKQCFFFGVLYPTSTLREEAKKNKLINDLQGIEWLVKALENFHRTLASFFEAQKRLRYLAKKIHHTSLGVESVNWTINQLESESRIVFYEESDSCCVIITFNQLKALGGKTRLVWLSTQNAYKTARRTWCFNYPRDEHARS